MNNTPTKAILSFLTYSLIFVFLTLTYIINILILPLARIPFKKKKRFKLKVMLKAIHIACSYRDIAEGLVGNKLLFFSIDRNKNEPSYLYIRENDFQNLPTELIKVRTPDEMEKQNKTLIIEVEARKSLLCGYISAKIINYEVANEKPEFSK